MERRNFIKLAGFTTFGLMSVNNIFASNLKLLSYELIEIVPPNVHVRHGFFNVQKKENKAFHIQRDIFNNDGLENISDDRMASIKISDKNIESYGILDKTNFNSKSKRLSAISLRANKSTSMKLDSPCIIFAEYNKLTINGVVVEKDQAFVQYSRKEIVILSESNQSVFIYKINS